MAAAKAIRRINESGLLKKKTRRVVAASSYTISRDCTRSRDNVRARLFAIACSTTSTKAVITEQQPHRSTADQLVPPSTLTSQSAGKSGQRGVRSESKGLSQGERLRNVQQPPKIQAEANLPRVTGPNQATVKLPNGQITHQITHQILESVQRQGPFSGWHAAVPFLNALLKSVKFATHFVSSVLRLNPRGLLRSPFKSK